MNTANDKDTDVNQNNDLDNQQTEMKPVKDPTENQSKAQTLDDLLSSNGDLYNSIRGLVTDIKVFESNKYKNLSDFGREFAANYQNYIASSPLSNDPKTLGFSRALGAMLNSPENADKKKDYIQKVINYISIPLSAEYNKIAPLMKPEDYQNIVRGSMNDPMIMFNPFAQNMKNELGKDKKVKNGLILNELTTEIKTDYEKGDYSKLPDYFEKIPYDMDVFKNTGMKEDNINTMIKAQNDLFREMSEKLTDDTKKQLMEALLGITMSESSKQLSKLDGNSSMNAVKAANPDAITGLYLALNAGRYRNFADNTRNAYSQQPAGEMGYDVGGGL